MVHADVEVAGVALVGLLDLIHRKVGVLLQGLEVGAVLREPRHAAGNADVQRLAVGQGGTTGPQGPVQGAQLFADGVLRVVPVEQQQELVAGQAGADGALGGVGGEALTGLADVLVAPVVAVGVVDVLEVVEVHHQQGRAAQPVGMGEEIGADPVEGLTAVQAGQDVVIALMLDALLFQNGGGDILQQTHLRGRLCHNAGDAEDDVLHIAVRLRNGENGTADGSGAVQAAVGHR